MSTTDMMEEMVQIQERSAALLDFKREIEAAETAIAPEIIDICTDSLLAFAREGLYLGALKPGVWRIGHGDDLSCYLNLAEDGSLWVEDDGNKVHWSFLAALCMIIPETILGWYLVGGMGVVVGIVGGFVLAFLVAGAYELYFDHWKWVPGLKGFTEQRVQRMLRQKLNECMAKLEGSKESLSERAAYLRTHGISIKAPEELAPATAETEVEGT